MMCIAAHPVVHRCTVYPWVHNAPTTFAAIVVSPATTSTDVAPHVTVRPYPARPTCAV